MTITTRAGKGGALSHAEMDENFTDLRDGVALVVPRTEGTGIKVDSLGTPTFGWHDLLGTLFVPDPAALDAPQWTSYNGTIKQYLYDANSEAQVLFHMPHDYVTGTDIFIHAHWSHNSTLVTGGSVTIGFEISYAKGHNQQAFSAPITIVELQSASTTQYQHLVCEALASTPGGAAALLDTATIEPDGIIIGRIFLDSNDITVSGGPVPDIFIHTVDIHYQSSGVATKNRGLPFWGP